MTSGERKLLQDTHDTVVKISTQCKTCQDTISYHDRVIDGKNGDPGLKGELAVQKERVDAVEKEAAKASAWSRKTIGAVLAGLLAMIAKWVATG